MRDHIDWRNQPLRTNRRIFVFMHLPKCGGTTFTRSVVDSMNSSLSLLYNPEGDGWGHPGITWALGHNPVSWMGHHSTDEVWCALFRNPVRRVRSHIQHLDRLSPSKSPTIQRAVAMVRQRNCLQNHVTRMLSARDTGPRFEEEEPSLERAIDNLARIKVVGDLSHLVSFYHDVSLVSGYQINGPPDIEHSLNVSMNVLPESDELDAEIRERNQMDLALYRAVRRRLETGKAVLS